MDETSTHTRADRVRALLADIANGAAEPEAMRERYGMTVREARAWLRTERSQRDERAPAPLRDETRWGRVRGLYMRPEVEDALVTLGRMEGGQGKALGRAMSLYAMLIVAVIRGRGLRVVVDLEHGTMDVVPPPGRPRPRDRATARGQLPLWPRMDEKT